MTTSQKTRVLIVDDHAVVRHGLMAIIAAAPDMEVVGDAGDAAGAVATFEKLRPDVTLMDLRLTGQGNGVDAIRGIRTIDPQARVLVLTSYDGDEDIFRALQAGARGYLLKGTFPEGMLEGIRAVYAGELLLSPEVASRLEERHEGQPLSAREAEILELVAKGLSNKEIGAVLGITEGTTKNHLKRVFAKLDVTDRTEAALLAIRRGIVRLS